MKKQYLRIMVALVGFVGLSGIANAQGRGKVVVTLPFEFVVGGKTLPAGTYTVSRLVEDKHDALILSNYDKRVSVLVHPIEVESAVADKPSVSFERVGESHFLSKIETEDDVYTIPVSRVAIMEAALKTNGGTPSSTSSGNN